MGHTEEIWKDIPGYENRYQVSNLGRIKACWSRAAIIRKQSIVKGYKCVILFTAGRAKNLRVHRLVAQAFIPNPDNKPEVNHIDGDKLNNLASNLEWSTRSENMKHAYDNKLIMGKMGRENNQSRRVINTNTGEIYDTVSRAADSAGVSRYAMYRIVKGLNQSITHFQYV